MAKLEVGMFCVLGLTLVLGIGILVFTLIDGVQGYRAFDAKVACQAERMEPIRKPLSADVVCVPAIMRQDTTTVNLQQ